MNKSSSARASLAKSGTGKAAPEVPEKLVRARGRHGYLMVAAMYETQLKAVVGEDAPMLASAKLYALDLLERVSPRDPLEELLVAQMLQTHARTMYLNAFAAQQTNLKWSGQLHEAADRASNTFRRQMLALAEYRNPRPPSPRNLTQIAQANIAQQQVVQQTAAKPAATTPGAGNATNEQGIPGTGSKRERGQKGLPLVGGGPGEAPGNRGKGQAVDEEHRPADGRREGRSKP